MRRVVLYAAIACVAVFMTARVASAQASIAGIRNTPARALLLPGTTMTPFVLGQYT